MTTVLLVEDEESYREPLAFKLRRDGFEVVAVADGLKALAAFDRGGVDIVLLDLMLPGLSGTEVCRELRQRGPTPVIMLTAKDSEIDKVVGLEIGADDYVTKPFSPRELALRAQAIVRRSRRAPDTEQIVNGALVIDPAARTASHDGTVLHLSDVEFRLLAALARRPGQPVGVRDLLNEVWHTTETAGGRDMIKTTVHRLRHRLGPAGGLIVTVRGVGYLMPALDAD